MDVLLAIYGSIYGGRYPQQQSALFEVCVVSSVRAM